jgi:drug/metabolite transporter (DMT)-like permease
MNKRIKELEGEVFALVSAIGVTGYLIINRYIYIHYKPSSLDYTATFIVLAGIIGLLSFSVQRIVNKKIATPTNLPLLISIGIVAGSAIGLVVMGQKYTTAANAGLIGSLTVVTTLIFTRMILKQALHRSKIPWVLLLLIGVYLAIEGLHLYHLHTGDLLLLTATILYGLSNVLTRIALEANTPGTVRDVRFITAGSIFALLFLLSVTNFVTTAGILPFIAALFFWTGIVFFNRAVKLIGPSNSIVINNAQIVLTMLLAIPLLAERLTQIKVVGALLMLLAIQRISSKRNQTKNRPFQDGFSA